MYVKANEGHWFLFSGAIQVGFQGGRKPTLARSLRGCPCFYSTEAIRSFRSMAHCHGAAHGRERLIDHLPLESVVRSIAWFRNVQKTSACYSSWGPLGEPTEPLVNQRPKILFKTLVKTSEPLAFPYTEAHSHKRNTKEERQRQTLNSDSP